MLQSRCNRRTLVSSLASACILGACAHRPNLAEPRAFEQNRPDLLQAALDAMRNDARFLELLENPEQFRLQIALSWRSAGAWQNASYRLSKEWLAPASMVKLPLAVLVLRELAARDLPLSTELRLVNPPECAAQVEELVRFEAISRSLERMLIVSDNGAYNRLLEFVGMHRVNALLNADGFPNALLQARLGACTPQQNSAGAGYEIRDALGNQIGFDASAKHPPQQARHGLSTDVGNAHYDFSGKLINSPRNFAASNHFSLQESHRILCNLADPSAYPEPLLDQLSDSHRGYLVQVLRTLPRQAHPPYSEKDYPDSYAKFLLWGGQTQRMPEQLQIANKIGEAYGFLTDSAWVVNSTTAQASTQTESFVLSAAMYVNADGILNDDKYEYASLGYPFLSELGRQVLAQVSKASVLEFGR